MTGPLAQMYAMEMAKRGGQPGEPMPKGRALSPAFYDDYGAFYKTPMDRTEAPMGGFRDPQQAGPEPPVDPRVLARLFGDR
jgi:hypothetical protein